MCDDGLPLYKPSCIVIVLYLTPSGLSAEVFLVMLEALLWRSLCACMPFAGNHRTRLHAANILI